MIELPPRYEPTTSPSEDLEDVLVAAQRVPSSGDDASVPPPVPAVYYSQIALQPASDPSGPCKANGPSPVILDRNYALPLPDAPLPVDVAATRDLIAVVAAANGHTPSLPQLVFVARSSSRDGGGDIHRCYAGASGVRFPGLQLTSVGFLDADTVVALSREPAALVVVQTATGHELARIPLSAESREDTGHAIFHANSGVGVACASCHPDGRDDGHSWKSIELGARRTPSLLGTLAGTAPYHWSGEAPDLAALMKLTFQSRMLGPTLSDDRIDAVAGWLRALEAPPSVKPLDPSAASRGKPCSSRARRRARRVMRER